jgi:hypothetical protein
MTRGYDEILEEEAKTLTPAQRRDLAIYNCTDSELTDLKQIEFRKTAERKRGEAEKAAQANEEKSDAPDFANMSISELNAWKAEHGVSRHQRDVLEVTLSDEHANYKKQGAKDGR